MPDFPLARTSRLLVEELDGELMVYDQDADTAHVLRDDVARVWQLCDGKADADRIASDLQTDVPVVTQALEELELSGLLVGTSVEDSGLSRRDAVKKVAKVGAAAASVPLIYSLAIGPAAAMASPVTCSHQTCSAIGILNGALTITLNNQCAVAAGCQPSSTCNVTSQSGLFPLITFSGTCAF